MAQPATKDRHVGASRWGVDDKHPLDPGWMWQLAPSVRALIFEDDVTLSMLKKIRNGRRAHTALRTVMMGSLTPIFWALGAVAATATVIVALPVGLTIAPIVTWGAWASLAGVTAAYHAFQVGERRLRAQHMKVWSQFAERLSRNVLQRARGRHDLEMRSLDRTTDVDLQECDRFAKRLLGLATLGRDIDENYVRRMGALWGVLPFAPIVVPLAYAFGRWRRRSERAHFFEAQKLGKVTAEADAAFAASTNEFMSAEAIKGARWSGLKSEADALHVDDFERLVAATVNETELRQRHELSSTRLLSNLSSFVLFVASAGGSAPATTLVVNNALGLWASQLALVPAHEMAVAALAASSESLDRVLQAAAGREVAPRSKQTRSEISGPFRVHIQSLVLDRGQRPSDPISASIRSGELTAISGPNGSFKSSLMLALWGDVTPISGVIRSHALSRHGNEISPEVLYMPANSPALLKARLAKWGQDKARVEETLHRLGRTEEQIRDLLANPDKAMGRMSKGEQARTVYELTVALSDSPVVVVDEPLAHLDRVNARKFLHNLRDIAARDERAIVVVDNTGHSMVECDRLILMDQSGGVISQAPPLDSLVPAYVPPWAWPLIEHRDPFMRAVRDSLTGEDNKILAEKWHASYGKSFVRRFPVQLCRGDDAVVELFRSAGSKLVHSGGPSDSPALDGRTVLTVPPDFTYFDQPFQPSEEFRNGLERLYLADSPADTQPKPADRALTELIVRSKSLTDDLFVTHAAGFSPQPVGQFSR